MARGKVEQQVEALSRLRAAPRAEAHAGLERALRDRSNLVVAKAATVAGELGLAVLTADLLAAFDRLLEHSAERDPQCWGKNALAKALVALGHDDPAPYLRGVRHTQMESVWGGREDTAQTLRGTCLLALAACPMLRREEFLRCLVDALAENNVPVRLEAVRGLEQAGGEEAILVLRLKARLGDGEPRVMGQVFDALLRLEGEAAVPFLAGILETGEGETREEAALALGGSRFPVAFEQLKTIWERTREPGFRGVLLRAIGACRLDPAIEFLLSLVKSARAADAEDALEALALHRDSPEIAKLAGQAAGARGSDWQERFARYFGGRVRPQDSDRSRQGNGRH